MDPLASMLLHPNLHNPDAATKENNKDSMNNPLN